MTSIGNCTSGSPIRRFECAISGIGVFGCVTAGPGGTRDAREGARSTRNTWGLVLYIRESASPRDSSPQTLYYKPPNEAPIRQIVVQGKKKTLLEGDVFGFPLAARLELPFAPVR
jgi:hypothetical protein